MRIRCAGDSGLLLELDGGAAVAAWHAELLRRRDAGEFDAAELVPAARTVLIDGLTDPDSFSSTLRGWAPPPPAAAETGPLVEVPTGYDGPDLATVARHWKVTEDQVVERHTAITFRVAFCGFSPGFGYLAGLPDDWSVPRRTEPRARIPAGSVGLAGTYSGVYPSESPGGWQLIGRTDLVLFDPDRDPPALFTPGARVRFVVR
ncbi:MAG: 5-oxoprolinase subunit PxpB [Micromonosporaceae bacterium]